MPQSEPQFPQHDVYTPPQAELTAPPVAAIAPAFYVVSITKLVLLSFATLGVYGLYWFWRHWKLHKLDKKLDIWPVWRAIFSIFFAHSLNREIDYRLTRKGIRHAWSPASWATLYVFSVIAARIVSRIPDSVLAPNPAFYLSMVCVAGMILPMVHTQRAANLACGDPTAEQNRRLTAPNWAWLVLGAVLWLLILIGLMMPVP